MRKLLSNRRWTLLAGGALLAGASGAVLAQNGPQSLLPPGFDQPAAPAPKPTPTPAPAPAPAATRAPSSAAHPSAAATPGAVATTSVPVVQPAGGDTGSSGLSPQDEQLLDSIDPAVLDKLVESLRPKYDIPSQQQRSLALVGPVAQADGGLPALSTYYLNGAWVEGLLDKLKAPLVSRWGEIMLRRALASRLATPVGMNGADWAAIRANLLLRMGEADAARLMVEQVDSGSYTPELEDAAMQSFLATADPAGLCPIVALTARTRQEWQWRLSRDVCSAFTGDGPPAMGQLDRAMRNGTGEKFDILLAQKFAGAAATSRRAVTLEWKDVGQLTPWRFGMALATGAEPPDTLMAKAPRDIRLWAATAPMLPLAARAKAADLAAGRGILSAAAMVDLYSEIYAEGQTDNTWSDLSSQLRTAYVAPDENDRMAAIRAIWNGASDPLQGWSRRVLTAYAAARMVPSQGMSANAGDLIASMLTAGLDRDAVRWAPFVARGSDAWGMLAVATPNPGSKITAKGLDAFHDDDESTGLRRSKFLLAGLMGLGRVDDGTARGFAKRLDLDMGRSTRWTRAIDSAAASHNPTLVSFLAAFGMQGSGWDKMTPLYLYHIVSALHRAGLDGDARMIAAEAVARG